MFTKRRAYACTCLYFYNRGFITNDCPNTTAVADRNRAADYDRRSAYDRSARSNTSTGAANTNAVTFGYARANVDSNAASNIDARLDGNRAAAHCHASGT